MPQKNYSATIDKIIFGFIVVFLISLTNSIFVNQLGYYGALFFILVKFGHEKENPFRKNGLELALIIFLTAELLSGIFSANQPQSFNNMFKRALLLPVLYLIPASSGSLKQDKKYFYIFIGAAVLTTGYYLFHAYSYFVNNLYQMTLAGPDVLQYPITTSEILSFTSILLFAFLLSFKTKIKFRILTAILLGISLLALFSTYKRTGWIGVAAGIFIILILNKNWKTTGALIIFGTIILFFQSNISQIQIYNFYNDSLTVLHSINTEGRAYDTFSDDGVIYIADFEGGLKKVDGEELITLNEFAAPVTSFEKFNDSLYLAGLIDTRFVLLKKGSDKFIRKSEYLSTGFTVDHKIFNGALYVLDSDSGLTVFKMNDDSVKTLRFKEINNFMNLTIDSSNIVFSAPGKIAVYSTDNFLPKKLLWNYYSEKKINAILKMNNMLVFAEDYEIRDYKILGDSVVLAGSFTIPNSVISFYKNDSRLFYIDNQSIFGELRRTITGNLRLDSLGTLGFIPSSLNVMNDKVISTHVKRSRLSSIFDVYNPSNYSRFAFWSAGLKMFSDHPLFGVGDIDLAKLYSEYKNYYDKEIQGHMHNNYVHLLVTLGLFGFLAVMFLFYKIIRLLFKIYNETEENNFISAYSLGAIGVFAAFLVSGLTEWNFGDHEIITLLWFIISLNISMHQNSKTAIENR